jgi:uncharacterized membrane protein YwaF
MAPPFRPFGPDHLTALGSTAAAAVAACAVVPAARVVNLLLDADFLFLRRKPSNPTLPDWLGPWPRYLVSSGLLGPGLFRLLGVAVPAAGCAVPRSG